MIKALLNEIASHGDRGAVVPVSRFEDLKHEMEELKSGVHHVWSDWMAEVMSIPNEPGFKPLSLITVITPSPKVMLQFNDRSKLVHCVMPPYYTGECAIGPKVLQYISAFLKPRGFSVAETGWLPLKLLAVHCGLARYGRNNIGYSNEFGSHMRLLAYVSDLPCEYAPCRRMSHKCYRPGSAGYQRLHLPDVEE
jgi:epoxyqueuosine reductase